MQGAETGRPLSVKDSGKAIPRSLPIIYVTHVTPNAMTAQNIAEERSFIQIACIYRGADTFLARPGRQKLQRQKILIFMYPIYNHNWRNSSAIYIRGLII